MRRHLPLLLLPLSLTTQAALPDRTGVPVLDARLPELQARFTQLNDNRQSLVQRPAATATWSCEVPRMTLLGPVGILDPQHDPVTWANFARANYGVNASIAAAEIVPLAGGCQNGRLHGAVSFWYKVDLQTDSPHFKGTSRSYGRASMTLADGKPAADIHNDVVVLTTSSNSRYVKASSDVDDALVNVSWKNVDDGFKHVADLASLAIGRTMKMSNVPSFTVWTVRTTTSPDTLGTIIYSGYANAGSPTTFADRYDSTGSLVERHMGTSRFYLAADGSWKSETVGAPSGPLAGGALAASSKEARMREKASLLAGGETTATTTTPSATRSSGITPIEGNTGRYLSPITSDGVAAAWVDKAINASLGSSLGGMAGAYAGQKALEQVPFIGGFLGQKAGAAAGRGIALKSVGGEAYLRETSDLSFNDINDMATWLVQTHASHARFADIMKAAGQIYPELTPAYVAALRRR